MGQDFVGPIYSNRSATRARLHGADFAARIHLLAQPREKSAREEIYQVPQLLIQVPILNLSQEALKHARSRPIHPRYLDMSEEMAQWFHLSLTGGVTPAQAIETLRRELSDIV